MDYPGDLLLHLASFQALLAEIERGRPSAFERTAQRLGVDRSVLRRRVRTLDAWIGAPLLSGRGAALGPSPAGVRLAERGARLLAGAKELRADVALARDRITIGCTGTITTELLPRVLVSLEKRKRPVQLVVKRAGGALCEALLRSGEVDLGVVRADEPPAAFAHEHLTDDRLWFVLPEAHPLAKSPKLTHAQMASVPLVLYGESSRTRARIMDRLAPHGASIRIEVEGRAAALEYVRAGIGATFLSLLPGHQLEVARRGRSVHARDVTPQFARSRFYVIAQPRRWNESLIEDVRKELRQT